MKAIIITIKIMINNVCRPSINNVYEFSIDLPNKSDKGINAKSIESNINSPLP